MGSNLIKVALFSPISNYPFNSPAWPSNTGFKTLVSMAQHEYYTQLWAMPEFKTYILIAYSTVGGAAGTGISYWTKGITSAQAAEETKQLYECASYFLNTYASEGKTFVFENWEGDWASRAGGYDPSVPATPLALASMRTWLEARQAGVTRARREYREEQQQQGRAGPGEGSAGNVFFAAEVNLVQASREKGDRNMITDVVPYVALDTVSCSSYDTQVQYTIHRALY
jgi:hypothetical protein